MKRYLVVIIFALLTFFMVNTASAVKIIHLDPGGEVAIVPVWFEASTSPVGDTVITVDGGDPTNFEIKLGFLNWGAAEFDTQAMAIRGAGAVLPASPHGYRVEFDAEIYSFDSYDAPGTAPPEDGYWDVFAVNINTTGSHYWDLVNGGGGAIGDPIVAAPGPAGSVVTESSGILPGETWAWGGLDYSPGGFEGEVSGGHSLTLVDPTEPYYVSFALDTATIVLPDGFDADEAYPSYGAFNPLTTVPEPIPQPIPEPTTMALLGIGLAGLGGRYLKRRRSRQKK